MKSDLDIIIVGGGIQGAGVAQIAALNGFSVLVLEKNQIGSGTTRKSSKLIHGGFRYLESLQFSLVRECLEERSLLLKLAPSLVKLQPFYIPIYRQSKRSRVKIHAGLTLYRWLTGQQAGNQYRCLKRSEWSQLDGLHTEDLLAVFQYWDAQTNDQQLTQAVMQSAMNFGAQRLEQAEVIAIEVESTGVNIQYQVDGNLEQKRAKVLVNCAGPWVNAVLAKVRPSLPLVPVSLVAGTHILVDQPNPQGFYYVESPLDQRAVFVMPWKNKALIGTTERLYEGNPDQLTPLPAEVQFLQETFAHYFRQQSPRLIDAFAGARVLPKSNQNPFHRSREAIISLDQPIQPRVLSLVGGKLTSYRINAENLFRQILRTLPVRGEIQTTKAVPLTTF